MVGQEIISEVSQYDLAVEEYLEVAHRSALVIVLICLLLNLKHLNLYSYSLIIKVEIGQQAYLKKLSPLEAQDAQDT